MSKLLASQVIFANNIGMLVRYIFESGFFCTFGEAYRSPEQESIAAKMSLVVGDSQHCKRLAIDLNLYSLDGVDLTDPQAYKEFGDYWKSLNPANKFGGDFEEIDNNHFEMCPIYKANFKSMVDYISKNFGIEKIEEEK